MSADRFTGAGVALVTPFKSDGSVDFDGLRKVTEHTIQGGIDFLVVLGTTAETPTLESGEKEQVVATILDVNTGRKPVVLGIGGNDTAAVLRAIQKQSFEGIDGLLNVAPYYNKPNQTGLLRHFEAVGTLSPVPVIIYNVPGRTGCSISADTTLRLAADIPNIIATKEASGNFDQIMTILRDKPEGFKVLSGDDALTLPLMSLGAAGVISVVANRYPDEMAKLCRLALDGDFESARYIHNQLLEFVNLCFAEGSPAGIKASLSLIGICEETVRLPLVPVSASLKEKIRLTMNQM